MSAIDARHLELTYADGTEDVRDVSMDIPEGEFSGFPGVAVYYMVRATSSEAR